MKQYFVIVGAEAPYPIKKEFRVNATSFAASASRAIKLFRKAIGRKKITHLTLVATVLGKEIVHDETTQES